MFNVGYCGYNISNVDYDTINRPDGTPDYLFLYFLSPMIIELDNIIVNIPA